MEQMHLLADEIRETFSDQGHAIGKAVGVNPVFRRTRRPQSALAREMVLDAVERASTRCGLNCIPVAGGSLEVADFVGTTERRFRVLKATKNTDTDDYEILCKSDAVLVIPDAEPESLYRLERWVFGYTVDESSMVVDIFAARALGKTDDTVPRLVMGPAIALGSTLATPPTGPGFQPADEDDLDGFGDEAADDEGGSEAV